MKWGRGESEGQSFCSCGAGVHAPPAPLHGCVHARRSSPNPVLLGFSWRFHLAGISSPSPLSLENGRYGWKFQTSNHGLACWGNQPPTGSPKSHLFRTKDAPKTQEIPKAAGALDQEPGKRLNVRIKRCSQCSSHGGSHQSPSSSVPGTRGRDQHGYFPLAHGAGAGFWTKTRDSKARALRTVLAAGLLVQNLGSPSPHGGD